MLFVVFLLGLGLRGSAGIEPELLDALDGSLASVDAQRGRLLEAVYSYSYVCEATPVFTEASSLESVVDIASQWADVDGDSDVDYIVKRDDAIFWYDTNGIDHVVAEDASNFALADFDGDAILTAS